MLFANELQILAQENNNNIKLIEEDEYQHIIEILECLQEANVAILKIERVKKELIEFALEAQDKQISFQELLGKDEKEYIDEIIASSNKATIGESFASMAMQCYGVSFLLIIISMFQADFPRMYGISYGDILLLVFWIVLLLIGNKMIRRTLIVNRGEGIYFMSNLPVLIGAVFYFLSASIFPFAREFIFIIPIELLFVILAIPFLFISMWSSHYWKKEAKKYK